MEAHQFILDHVVRGTKIFNENLLIQDIDNLLNSIATHQHELAFMNAASPGVINVFMQINL